MKIHYLTIYTGKSSIGMLHYIQPGLLYKCFLTFKMRTLGWSFHIFICLAMKVVKVCWICDVLNEHLAEVLRWFYW